MLRSSANRARRPLAEKLAAAPATRALWPSFMACLRSTFAHWAHADSYRLRQATLRDLGLLYPDAPPCKPLSSVAAAREERYRDGELVDWVSFDNGWPLFFA